MPPQTLIRAADFRPVELHDLLVSDGKFKVLVFTGDTSLKSQRGKLEGISREIEVFLRRFGGGRTSNGLQGTECEREMFDITSISSATKANVRYTDLPPVLRSHWSK
jgi:phenol 2-monooxygenase